MRQIYINKNCSGYYWWELDSATSEVDGHERVSLVKMDALPHGFLGDIMIRGVFPYWFFRDDGHFVLGINDIPESIRGDDSGVPLKERLVVIDDDPQILQKMLFAWFSYPNEFVKCLDESFVAGGSIMCNVRLWDKMLQRMSRLEIPNGSEIISDECNYFGFNGSEKTCEDYMLKHFRKKMPNLHVLSESDFIERCDGGKIVCAKKKLVENPFQAVISDGNNDGLKEADHGQPNADGGSKGTTIIPGMLQKQPDAVTSMAVAPLADGNEPTLMEEDLQKVVGENNELRGKIAALSSENGALKEQVKPLKVIVVAAVICLVFAFFASAK